MYTKTCVHTYILALHSTSIIESPIIDSHNYRIIDTIVIKIQFNSIFALHLRINCLTSKSRNYKVEYNYTNTLIMKKKSKIGQYLWS